MSIYVWTEIPPLNFTANTANSTVQLTKNWTPTEVTLEKSTDGNTWSSYTIWDTITLTNIWDKVYFRNTSTTDTGFSIWSSNYYKFVMTGSIAWSWDITYLLNKNGTDTVSGRYCFGELFYQCSSLTTAPELPATTLGEYCYHGMFVGCTWLTTAPELPATTMFPFCYANMFRWCTWLTAVSKLPATTLGEYCYYCMFYWCNWLTSIPKLPATTLSDSCYGHMFRWCSLIKLSTTQTGSYQTTYRIPTTWTWTIWTESMDYMFYQTWWTFTWTPTINTTYYTSNTVV